MNHHHSDGWSVRASAPSDLPDFRRIINATGLFPAEMLNDMVAPFFAGVDAAFWLTLECDSVEGFAYCVPERMTEGTWNLLLIAIDPALHRGGRGAKLIRAVEAGVRERSGRLLLVEMSGLPEFEGQRGFYHAQGFGEEARIRDFYQAGEDKVVFWKRLP